MTDETALRSAMIGYQAGDQQAFEALYPALVPLVRRHLRRLGCRGARVEDLVQETFLQLHRARQTYDRARPVAPWACAIARHVFLVDCRYRRRRAESLHDPFEDPLHGVQQSGEGSLATRACLHGALSSLSPGTRAPLLMHHVGGLSFDEISTRLHVRPTAARARVSRGMARLRQTLRVLLAADE